MTQQEIKEVVFKRLNDRMGRELPVGISARAESIIIGVVFNMPYSREYTEKDYRSADGIIRRYDKSLEVSPMDFSKIYPNGMSYGIVLSVGEGVKSTIVYGDKVILRSMPSEMFCYNGEMFHVNKEWDIAAIVSKKDNSLEEANK
jgi:hypothetical protein